MDRDELDTLLRDAPRPPDPTLEDERAGFAQFATRPLPGDVTASDTTLGGRPALDLQVEPARRAGRLLYFHGGGYMVGSPRTHAGLTAELARRTGVHAVSLDYRRTPEHPFPAATDDALAAYRALLDGGIRPGELVLAGDSAGGALVVATLLGARSAGLPQPAAAVVFSPWVDLTLAGESLRTKHGTDPIFTVEHLRHYTDAYLPAASAADLSQPLASPVFTDLRGLPPLLIQVGSNEVLLDDAVRLAGREIGRAHV